MATFRVARRHNRQLVRRIRQRTSFGAEDEAVCRAQIRRAFTSGRYAVSLNESECYLLERATL